jgi:hypothetical protein
MVVTCPRIDAPYILQSNPLFNTFHAMHKISCLEALTLLVWIYVVLEKISERNSSYCLSVLMLLFLSIPQNLASIVYHEYFEVPHFIFFT